MRQRGSLVILMMMAVVMVVLQEGAPSRILVLTPVGMPSHNTFVGVISEELAHRNHSVTLVTSSRPSRVLPNIREVYIPDGDLSQKVPNLFTTSWYSSLAIISQLMIETCFKILPSKEIQELSTEKFDLIIYGIVSMECLFPVVYKIQAPVIFVSPNVFLAAYSDMSSNPAFSSLAASYIFDLQYPLTFTGRMISTLHDHLGLVFYSIWLPRMQARCLDMQLCPSDMPSFAEMRANGSLMIFNSIPTLENPPLPYTPTVLHAGGIHCRPSQSLPPDLEQWITGSGDAGFIYFSLGSVVKSSDMPETYRTVLVEVLASLTQRVLWKWHEETMEGLQSNVRLSKWLPQQDILGHPQLKLFITHGGLLSLYEATFHGVPVVGLPVYVDQRHNLRQAQREGWARVVYWDDLTYDSFRSVIVKALHDTSMRTEVRRRSRVMRDQPVLTKDWTAYWIEYVIRHHGALHLRCPVSHMPWYQLYNVDVWVFVVMVTTSLVILMCCLSFKTICWLLACCRISRKIKPE